MIGKIVGNYKILEALGEGGVGMVYKGVDTMLDREVAIKVLRPELASQTSVVERFRSEAVTLAKLSHPNIATLFSLFRQNNDLFMVLEFVRGEPLETIIQRRGRLSVEETIPIFCQALDGINHAHEVGIIHRDIKPSNMILTEAKTLKVLDFGIARLLGTSRMTRVGNIIGTLEYMSPEQVRGEETDARSDIYGLGMMLYEILTGHLPFETENEFALMKMQTEEMPALPRQLNPDIPVEIEDAIMRSVAKNPNERFQHAGEFLQTLLSVDIPMATGNKFGYGSMFQAKFNTRPSKPGIEKTEQLPNFNMPPVSNRTEYETSENTTAPVNKTTEFVPNAADKQEANIQGEKTEILPPINIQDQPTAVLPGTNTQDQKTEILPDVTPVIKETRLGAGANQPSQQKEIKETRLGAAVPAAVPAANVPTIKSTRLGGAANAGGNVFAGGNAAAASSSASFFDKLTWVHYAGAGAAVLFLFFIVGVAIAIPFLFSGGGDKTNTNTAVAETGNKTEPVNTEPETKSDPETTSVLPSDSGKSDGSSIGENINTNIPVGVEEETPDDTSKGESNTKGKKPVEDKKNSPRSQPPKSQPPTSTKTPKAQPPTSQPPTSTKTPKTSGSPPLTIN